MIEAKEEKCKQQRRDCLHCDLWPVIHRFCAEHPNGCVQDLVDAVAQAMGDFLGRKDVEPARERLWQQTRERIRTRMKDAHEETRRRHG
jgi:hypothetical protein